MAAADGTGTPQAHREDALIHKCVEERGAYQTAKVAELKALKPMLQARAAFNSCTEVEVATYADLTKATVVYRRLDEEEEKQPQEKCPDGPCEPKDEAYDEGTPMTCDAYEDEAKETHQCYVDARRELDLAIPRFHAACKAWDASIKAGSNTGTGDGATPK